MDVMAASEIQNCMSEQRSGDEIVYSVQCPSLASWVDMRTKLEIVKSSCSPLFLESNEGGIKDIEERLNEQRNALLAACKQALAAKATAAARKLMACAKQPEESTDEALFRSAFGSVTCLTGAAISPITELCSKEELASYEDMSSAVAHHSATLVAGASWLLGFFKGESCDVDGDTAKSTSSSLGEIAQFMPKDNEFHQFVQVVDRRLTHVVRQQLTASISFLSPFYVALGDNTGTDGIIALAKTLSKRLKSHRSDMRFGGGPGVAPPTPITE